MTEGFNQGVSIAKQGKEIFYINKKGERLHTPDSDKLYPYQKGGVAFIRKDKKIGLIDTSGKVILPPTYDVIRDFKGGFARVRNNGLWGIIDLKGKVVVPAEYQDLGEWENGKMTWAKKGEEYGILTGSTFKAIEGVVKIWDFNGRDITYAKKGELIGYIDKQGRWVIEPKFTKARAFNDGLAPVVMDQKWGYTNTSGELVIPATYEDAEVFNEGLAPVKIGKNWGFINTQGELVIPADYQITIGGGFGIFQSADSKGFINGLARVKNGKTWGFLKKDGSVLGQKWYDNL